MRKAAMICLVVACAAGLGPQAWAQGWGVEFKAGFSLARIHETSDEPLIVAWTDLPFFAAGLSLEGPGLASIEPEILYVQQGGKYDIDAANGLTNRYHYLQIPVQLRISPVRAGTVRPFVAAGGYGAYLIRADSILKVDDVPTKADVTSEYVRWDWGIIGSAGLAFKMPGITLSVEARYNLGLVNILKNPVAGDSLKTRCLMALIGLRY
jgi:hypothetical protein